MGGSLSLEVITCYLIFCTFYLIYLINCYFLPNKPKNLSYTQFKEHNLPVMTYIFFFLIFAFYQYKNGNLTKVEILEKINFQDLFLMRWGMEFSEIKHENFRIGVFEYGELNDE